MGLFSKMKDAQQQAQEAMAGAASATPGAPPPGMAGMPGMGGQDMAAMAAMSQKLNKIATSGIEAPGIVKAIRVAGSPDVSGATMHHIDVTVAPDGGTPYDATVEQAMLPVQLESLAEGNMVTVKYDPDNPAGVILHSW